MRTDESGSVASFLSHDSFLRPDPLTRATSRDEADSEVMVDRFERIVRRVLATRAGVGPEGKAPCVRSLTRSLSVLWSSGCSRRQTAGFGFGSGVFDLLFDNLQIEPAGEGEARLVRVDAGRRAVLIVKMPPQGFAEQAFFDARTPLDGTGANELPPTRDGKPMMQWPTARNSRSAIASLSDTRSASPAIERDRSAASAPSAAAPRAVPPSAPAPFQPEHRHRRQAFRFLSASVAWSEGGIDDRKGHGCRACRGLRLDWS